MLQRIRLRLAGEEGLAVLELLLVAVAIGVALGVAVPGYLALRGDSADAKTKDSLRAAMPAADAYYADRKTYAGLDSADLLRIDPRVSMTVSVTSAKRRSYCLTESLGGSTWSVRGPNPTLVTDSSATEGWYEGDRCA